jgi:tRNA-splicing ligase RtcB
MKKAELVEAGIPVNCHAAAIKVIQDGFRHKIFPSNKGAREALTRVAAAPEMHLGADDFYRELASTIIATRKQHVEDEALYAKNSIGTSQSFASWGADIEQGAIDQMQNAVSLPVSVVGAMMPDAHSGYGLPVGGVLATYDSIVPYAVGVDIGCRMRFTFTDIDPSLLKDSHDKKATPLCKALREGTVFGVGGQHEIKMNHPVMDKDWNITAVTKAAKDKAWRQLGTSGSGNHFAEWGIVTLTQKEFGLEPGKYVALMTHSGSRGSGSDVCSYYTDVAASKLPKAYEKFGKMKLAWLPMASEAGQEYWAAMNLMGDYAAANHYVIHELVLKNMGATALKVIENHHNFAWKEDYKGTEVYVHRKGATPAGKGVLGIIPGSMATSAFVVRGKGNPESLMSASHGAGRAMSRTKAKEQFNWSTWKSQIQNAGVRLLSGGIDEVPGAYKDIHKVMAQQTDLIDVVAEFMPKIVLMGQDGRSED